MVKRGVILRGDLMGMLEGNTYAISEYFPLVKQGMAYIKANPTDREVIKQMETAFKAKLATLVSAVLSSDSEDFAATCPRELGWVNDWLAMTIGSEAPGIFLACSALSLISAAIGHKRWLDRGYYTVFPPMSFILVGPSGTRKNTAINISMRLLDGFDIWEGSKAAETFRVVRDKITPESLVHGLKQEDKTQSREIIWVAPELAVAMGRQSYLTGIAPLLTRLLDHDPLVEDETLGRGKIKVYNTLFAFLAGTTKSWLVDAITPQLIQGGTTSRILFPALKVNPRVIWEGPKDPYNQILKLSEELWSNISSYTGEVQLDKKADEFMEEWYAIHKLSGDENILDEGYKQRKHIHILRAALVLSACEGETTIKVKHIVGGIKLLDYIEGLSNELFRELSLSKSQLAANEMLTYIQKKKKLTKADLARYMHNKVDRITFKEALEYLLEAKFIETVSLKKAIIIKHLKAVEE